MSILNWNQILVEAPIFIEKLLAALDEAEIDVKDLEMDHICYRVETEEQYRMLFDQLIKVSQLLVEDSINGRLISTFKLESPIRCAGRAIYLIELPMPKNGSPYKLGFEHAEFVVGSHVNLDEFAQKYPAVHWDKSALKKSVNPDIRIELDTTTFEHKMSAKFHHLSLEKVIEIEKKLNF